MTEVLIVGAGPVGLTLAAELARHGVRPRIVERRAEPLPFCRAIGVTPRSLEVWEDMGVARDMIDAGLWLEGMRTIIHGGPTFDSLPDYSSLPYGELGLPQYDTESILERHLRRFGVSVERGVELSEFQQKEASVRLRLQHADGRREETEVACLVGCDGAHSTVRHQLGLAFEGDAFPMMFMLGDVHIDWEVPRGYAVRALRLKEEAAPDMFVAIPLPEEKRYRVSMLATPDLENQMGPEHGIQSERSGPDLDQIQAVADDLLPDQPRLSDLRWSSTFRISMRLAEHYRSGRVFLAGDAAHIHPPTGGQGMNTGIQDAYNLAWKLALVLRKRAPAGLLDSYEAERRPVGAEVVERTRAASVGFGREKQGEENPLVNTQVLVHYRGGPLARDAAPELGETAPLPGDRAPDVQGLRRRNLGFPLRWFDILRGSEHLLLLHVPLASNKLAGEVAAAASLAGNNSAPLRVAVVTAAGDSLPEFPGYSVYEDGAGEFARTYGPKPAAFLIRPDGYIAWRGPAADHPDLADFIAEHLTG